MTSGWEYDREGEEWVEASLHSPLTSTLKLTTWNVWFEPFECLSRWRALLAEVRREAPHVAAFQEVTPSFLRLLTRQEWVRDAYVLSRVDPDGLGDYGVVLMARAGALSFHEVPLPSAMGRSLVFGQFAHRDRLPVTIGTVHFESSVGFEAARMRQYGAATEALPSTGTAFLMGDFNFDVLSPENGVIEPPWEDLWASAEPGYTRDAARNPLVARRSPGRQARIDRVVARDLHPWRPSSMRLLGREVFDPARPDLRPSDHFGIALELVSAG